MSHREKFLLIPLGVLVLLLLSGLRQDRLSNTRTQAMPDPEYLDSDESVASLGNIVESAPFSNDSTNKPFSPVATESESYHPIAEVVVPTGDTIITRGVEEKGGYAYLLTRDAILYTYDISDLPNRTSFTRYDSPISQQQLPNGNGLLINGNYMYAFGYSGLTVLDLQNPASPNVLGTTGHIGIYNLVKYGNYLIAPGQWALAVYSITNPAQPSLLSTYYASGKRFFASTAYGDTIYASEFEITDYGPPPVYTYGLHVLDFSNPSDLSLIQTSPTDQTAYHMYIANNKLVQCTEGSSEDAWSSTISIWGLDDPTNPTRQFSQPLDYGSTRVCALDEGNLVVNGWVFHLVNGALETLTTFDPMYGNSDGFPYGSATTSAYVLLAQSPRILILEKGGDIGFDPNSAQSIEVSSKGPPFPPNRLTLEATIKNHSPSDSASDVTVTFYDGNPDGGGATIDSVTIPELGPDTSEKIAVSWWLNGNIENRQLYARITPADFNLANNTISRPISAYYVDFRHDEDAYSFYNSEVGVIRDGDIVGFLTDFDIPIVLQNVLLPVFGILTEVNGYCYGMANSSALYFQYPELKPVPSKTTFEHNVDEARAKIRTYQWTQLGTIVRVLLNLEPSEPSEQYDRTLQQIEQGELVIHGLMERNGILPEEGSHTVVAYKIIDLGDEKRVFYYDNNIPLSAFSSDSEETYGVFDSSGFSEPIYGQYGFHYNKAYVLEPQLSVPDNYRVQLLQLVRLVANFQFSEGLLNVTARGTADLLALDGQGRRAGYLEDQVFNEIPGATLARVDGMQSLLLPTSGSYQVQISRNTSFTTTTLPSLAITDPVTDSTIRAIQFQEIALAADETATLQFSHGTSDPQLVLPEGTTRAPDSSDIVDIANFIRTTHLPLIRR